MLTKEEIIDELESENLILSPLLDREEQVKHGGIDIRLGIAFIVSRNSRTPLIDPIERARNKKPLEYYQERLLRPIGEPLVLLPGETVLGATLEYIVLPPTIFGVISGRSSWGRMGLRIASGLFVTPGNKGCLTLELVNRARMPINVHPGLRIGQLLLNRVPSEAIISNSLLDESRYKYAIGPEFSKLHFDPEVIFFLEPDS